MSIPIYTEWFKKNNITFKEYTLIWIDVHNVCMTLNPFTGLEISCLCLRQYVLVHPMSFNIQTFETLALSLHTTVLNRHLVRTSFKHSICILHGCLRSDSSERITQLVHMCMSLLFVTSHNNVWICKYMSLYNYSIGWCT